MNIVNVIFWVSLFFYLNLGINSLLFTYPDEGRNAFATLFMLKSGDFIVPFYNGEIRYDKPPLLYYSAIILHKIFFFLNLEISFRLVSVLSIFFSALILFEFTKYFLKEDILGKNFILFRYLAVVIYCSFVNIFIESKAFVPEPLLTLFIHLSLLAFFKIYNSENTKFWVYVFWISLGFGMLAKGIVSFIVVFLIIITFLLIEKKIYFLKELFNLFSFSIGVLIGISWFVFVGIQTNGDFLYHFFFVHNVGRFTGSSNMHINPPYFYLTVILVNVIPIIEIFLISFFSFLYKIFKNQKDDFSNLKFLFVYFLIVLVFYSLSKGKVHHYIMPALLPLSVLISYFLALYFKSNSKFGWLVSLGLLIPLVLYFVKVPAEFLVFKRILLIFFFISTILYFLLFNFLKNSAKEYYVFVLTSLKVLMFYFLVTFSVSKVFGNQYEFLIKIKSKSLMMVGDISTVSFYNLLINNQHKTDDLWYILQTNYLNNETINEINHAIKKRQEVLIFSEKKYLDVLLNTIKEAGFNYDIEEVIVAQSKLKVVKIHKSE